MIMAKTKAKSAIDQLAPMESLWGPWLTRGAFVLTLIVMIARAMMMETVRAGFAMPGFSIRWETSAFEVSASGDMAYGVGTNTVTMNDAQGKVMTERGRSVTVWRKGADGRWRCVVDIWNAAPGAEPHR